MKRLSEQLNKIGNASKDTRGKKKDQKKKKKERIPPVEKGHKHPSLGL